MTYTRIYRIIHWATAIVFVLLLFTIFLRLTWLNKFHVAAIIEDYLKTTNQQLTQDQLLILAKKIRKPMWNWHIYFGYALVGLYVVRLTLPLFGEMKFQSPFDKNNTLKEKFQKWVYILFYACVVISLGTGLFIEFGPKSLKDVMEEIHELGVSYIYSCSLKWCFDCRIYNT